MRTRRSLAFLVAGLVFVVFASGVAAAQTGEGGSLVSLVEGLAAFLQRILDVLGELDSMA